MAVGPESLEDILGASEQAVHFQAPMHETCVAMWSWIFGTRHLVYAANCPQVQLFHLECHRAQYPTLPVGDMLVCGL